MENGNVPAHPIQYQDGWNENETGLSKREYFAGLAMQGILANQTLTSKLCSQVAKWSVEMSDALLAELEKNNI